MNLKEYGQGNLEFKIVKASFIRTKSFQPKFKFNDDYYHSESFGIEYYKSQGFNAFFAENEVWTKLLIYLFHNELKRSPDHEPSLSNIIYYLYDDEFFNKHQDRFLNRFDYLKNADLLTEIKNNCPHVDNKTIALCNHVESNQILLVLYDLLQDLNIKKRGFPDLFVYNDNESFFCEVKGNTDTLSHVQIKKHEVLLNAGIGVTVLGINKNNAWANEQKKRYFNEALFRKRNLIDNYDSKIYVSDKVFRELEDENIEAFKNKFINEYGDDTFIGFMNIINNFELNEKINAINSPNKYLIKRSVRKGEKIKELRILKNAKILEDKKKYRQAIEEYSKVDSFKSYKRIIYCYRALKDYESELNLIYKGINESNFKKGDKRFLKRRLNRFFKNKKSYTTIFTSLKCPYCGENVVLNKFHTRNGIRFLTCSKDKCYWYGGIYNGKIEDIK